MPHLDEGTIHAWLDGALSPAEAALAEEHIASCDECGAAVAEARGLIAASSRILTALDDVPSGVIPQHAPKPRPWYMRRQFQAAAALVLVAGTTLMLTRPGAKREVAATSAALTVATVATDTGPSARAEEVRVAPAATALKRVGAVAKTEQPEAVATTRDAEAPNVAASAPDPEGDLRRKAAEQNQGARKASQSLADEAAKQRFDAAVAISSAVVAAPAVPAPRHLLPSTIASARASIDSPIRVVSVERRIGSGPRTTYEVRPGVQVVLTEDVRRTLEEVVVIDPKAQRTEEKGLRTAAKAKKDSLAKAVKESVPEVCGPDTAVRELVRGNAASVQANPSAPSRDAIASSAAPTSQSRPPVATGVADIASLTKTLRWENPENEARYALTGLLSCEELKRVKALLPEAKR